MAITTEKLYHLEKKKKTCTVVLKKLHYRNVIFNISNMNGSSVMQKLSVQLIDIQILPSILELDFLLSNRTIGHLEKHELHS